MTIRGWLVRAARELGETADMFVPWAADIERSKAYRNNPPGPWIAEMKSAARRTYMNEWHGELRVGDRVQVEGYGVADIASFGDTLAEGVYVIFPTSGLILACAWEKLSPIVNPRPRPDSGYDPGTPYYEIYCAAPGQFDTKKNPTMAALGTAEHNAREYSRDGRSYVIEHVDAKGSRSKVAEFRNGRKQRA